MRWDFGFTCAFCLLHERDFADATGEAEGMGVLSTEHRLPQSSHQGERHHYENCLYACQYCNTARRTAPVHDSRGMNLLDPSSTSWAEHFELDGDRLSCRPGDLDARYTHQAYDLDDPRKVTLRAKRAELITYCLEVLRNGPRRSARLLEISRAPQLSPEDRVALLEEAERVDAEIVAAKRELEGRAAIPNDANRACRCGSTEHHELPPALASQMLEIDVS